MKFNLKNRPDAFASPRKVDEWFEGFDKRHRDFYCSSYLVENWLVDNELPNTAEVAHAIRLFIKKEILGDSE